MLMNRTTPFMVPVDEENPAIIKDEALCSQCGHCFAICEEEIGVAAKYLLNPRETYQCIGCGQCSANCPEKAIIGKPHYKIVKELLHIKNTLTRKRLFLWQLPLVLPKRQKSQERSYVMQESFLI